MTNTLVALVSLAFAPSAAAPRIDVIVPVDAPRLEKFAANELSDQLKRLFGAEVRITDIPLPGAENEIYLGSPATNRFVKAAAGDRWPKLSDQGHVLKSAEHDGRPVLLVGGGSPVATLWAVYELGHRFGVRYMPFGDLMPVEKPKLRLDRFDVVMEPTLKTRAWIAIGKEVIGTEMWSLEQHKQLLRQLAKMKFNRVILEFHPWQPFVHYEFKGVKKQTGVLALGRRFPVDGDTAGKNAFAGATVYENPDFAGKTTYEERTKAGIALARGIIDVAHGFGMTAGISFAPLDSPVEFKQLFPKAHAVYGSNDLAIRTTNDDIADAQTRAYRETYPKADAVYLIGNKSLVVPDLAVDKEPNVFRVESAELFHWVQLIQRGKDLGAVFTLNHRSIGVWPHFAASRDAPGQPLQQFVVRAVVPGDLSPSLHFHSRAAFDKTVTLDRAFDEIVTASCGDGVAERTTKAFRLLQELTSTLYLQPATHHLIPYTPHSAGAPDPDSLTRFYVSTDPPPWLKKARELYTKSYEDTLRGMQRSKAGPASWLFYVSKRQEFALAYLDCVEALCLAGQAKAKGEKEQHVQQLEKAVESIYNALDCYAEVARDQSDRGVIAVLNEFGYRPLKKLLDEAEKK